MPNSANSISSAKRQCQCWLRVAFPFLLFLCGPAQGGQTLLSSQGRYRLIVQQDDRILEFCFEPGRHFWGPVNLKINRIPVGDFLIDTGPSLPGGGILEFGSARKDEQGGVEALWILSAGEEKHPIRSRLRFHEGRLKVRFHLSPGLRTFALGRSVPYHLKGAGHCPGSGSNLPVFWWSGGEPRPVHARLLITDPALPDLDPESHRRLRLPTESSVVEIHLEFLDADRTGSDPLCPDS